jgi:hypothetical protein
MFKLQNRSHRTPSAATITAAVGVTKFCKGDKVVPAESLEALAKYVVTAYHVGSGEKRKVVSALEVAMNSNRLSVVMLNGKQHYEPSRVTSKREADNAAAMQAEAVPATQTAEKVFA